MSRIGDSKVIRLAVVLWVIDMAISVPLAIWGPPEILWGVSTDLRLGTMLLLPFTMLGISWYIWKLADLSTRKEFATKPATKAK